MRLRAALTCLLTLSCTGTHAQPGTMGAAAGPPAASEAAVKEEDEVREALQRYARSLKAMDAKAIAAAYTADGEGLTPGAPTLRGPSEIEAHLATFSAYHVLEAEMLAGATSVAGQTAHQQGTWSQRVTLPSGETVQAHGRFSADWRRVSGAWKLARLETTPEP
jgi:uncharacterized protein (TIGR02246 family)